MPPDSEETRVPDADQKDAPGDAQPACPTRRELLSSACMLGGLVAGYGACAAVAARYLYASEDSQTTWQLAATASSIQKGSSIEYRGPSGETIAIARIGDGATVADFIALSSVCPHLGCQVHWQGQERRFFCPCHNGAFDEHGKGISGPPARAGQSLARYPLRLKEDLLFIEVPAVRLSTSDAHR